MSKLHATEEYTRLLLNSMTMAIEERVAVPDEDPEEALVGPAPPKAKRRKVLEFEAAHLDGLPSAQMYERSYMHRDNLSHVEVAQSAEFLITASIDGHVKFWKKRQSGVEFAKHFRAHLGPIAGLAVSPDNSLLASFSHDRSVKVFDIKTLDMMAMLRISFTPSTAEWISRPDDSKVRLAIADMDSPNISVFDVWSDSGEALETFNVGHAASITLMGFCPTHNLVISTDEKGMFEYWSAASHAFPNNSVNFKYKMDTDLYALVKAKTRAYSLKISHDGAQFACYCADRKVRVWWLASGKLRRVYDESLEAAQDLQRSESSQFKLEVIDFGRRLSVEKDIEADPTAPKPNAIFDESGNFLIYPSLLGIKIVNLVTNRVAKVVGKVENTERFLRIALYQGGGARKAGAVARLPGGADSKHVAPDPTLLALAHQRQRLFLFSRREPEDSDEVARGRDVFNEKPTAELLQAEDGGGENGPDNLARGAVLHTTRGDISLKIFPDECPRTVENFCGHAKAGYYDNLIFHRVIKGFCIQTGDPLGDGTGGTSIWGQEFEDEFSPSLRHDRAFTLSMANAGPNTNGSQFFITTVPTPWLDGKHTVFGRVTKGADVVQNIEKAKTNKDDRPFDDIKIVNVEIKSSVE